MRELIIYTGYFAEPDENAAGKRVFGVALALENAGYDVLMLGKANRNGTNKIKYTNHIYFEALPEYGRVKYNGYFKHIVTVIEKQERKPKCIIRYSSPGLALLDYKLNKYCKKRNIPIVADVVDWLPGSGPNIFYKTVKTIDTFFEKAIFNKQGSGVIAISSYLGDYYKKYNRNVIVIPPLVPYYTKNEQMNEKRIIVYAGIPFRPGAEVKDKHKVKDRLDLAVKVCLDIYKEGIKGFKFNIYGVSRDEFLTAYPEYKSNLLEADSLICFHGKQRMDFIQREINKADYTILLREKNRGTMAGFSTKVVESLSCGTPVITTNTSDLNSYIIHGETGFYVDINDWNGLIAQVKGALLTDEKSLYEMKLNCYQRKDFLYCNYSSTLKSFIEGIQYNKKDS